MSNVNLMGREVAAKIVFYGPGLSGKTTTLRKIFETVRPAHRGEMMSIATEGDRTLFFDFLPVKVERVGDCAVRLALYTVPGQVFYNATRKLVLQGADGVVFVADSQPEALDSNREALTNLQENLLEQGLRIEKFPLVFQWNKRDIEKALPVEELRAALNPRGQPDFETAASQGRGVLDVLKNITRLVIKDLRAKRIVPSPRSTMPALPDLQTANAGLEHQVHQHLSRLAQERPPASRLATAVAPPALTGQRPLGPASALATGELFDHARAAEAAFANGDNNGCVRMCLETVRRGLAFAGEGPWATQASALGASGPDLLRLHSLAQRPHLRVDDAAFALYVMMQTFVRLQSAGLPPVE